MSDKIEQAIHVAWDEHTKTAAYEEDRNYPECFRAGFQAGYRLAKVEDQRIIAGGIAMSRAERRRS